MATGFAKAVCFDGTVFAAARRAGAVAFEVRAGDFGRFALAFFGRAALPATGRFGVPSAFDIAFLESLCEADFVATGAGFAAPFEFAILVRPSPERVAFEAGDLDADFVPVDIVPVGFFTTAFTGGLTTALAGRLEPVPFEEAVFATDLPSRFGELFGSACSLPGDFRGGGASAAALLVLAALAGYFAELVAAGTAAALVGALASFSFFRVAGGLTATELEFPAADPERPR